MSLAYGKKFTVQKIIDPLSDFSENQKRNFLTIEGSKKKYYKTQVATSSDSSQSIWSNVNPPSAMSLQSRHVDLKCRVRVTATGVNSTPGANLFQTGNFAFTNLPLASCMQTLTYNINGYPISRTISRYIHVLSRLVDPTKLREVYESGTCGAFDNCQAFEQTNLTNMNALSGFNDSTVLTSGRGSIAYDSLVNTPTSFTLEATLVEPLWITPLLFSNFDEAQGLYNVDSTQVQIVWEANLVKYMLSINPNTSVTFSNITVEILQYPELLFLYSTPNLLQPIPRDLVYPATNHQYVVQDTGVTVPAGGSLTFTSSNAQMSQIPDLVIHWFEVREQDKTPYMPNSYARINNVSINWNTDSGVLSSADSYSLWKMSVDAGVHMSYQDWSAKTRYLSSGSTTTTMNGAGSIFAYQVETLGVLDEGESSGLLKQVQYNATFTIDNPSPGDIRYQFCTLFVYNGILSIDSNKITNEQYGIISQIDLIDAPRANVSYNHARHMAEMGGGFWDGVKSALSTALKYAPILGVVGDAARVVQKFTGNGLSGGAMASRAGLVDHLKYYRR